MEKTAHDQAAAARGTAVITGCSSGIGRLTAQTLADSGLTVFAGMRDILGRNLRASEELGEWAANRDIALQVVELDVTSSASVESAVSTVLEQTGRIDVAVNNAGMSSRGPTEAFTIEQMQTLFETNVWGPLRVSQAVLPTMRSQRKGLVIHVTSVVGRVLPKVGGLYPASKWAAEGFSEGLHYQLAPFGVDVALVEPGSYPTAAALSGGMKPERAEIVAEYAAVGEQHQSRPPRATLADVQQVADAILELVRMPSSDRPLRTVVGDDFTHGVAEYNEAYIRARDNLRIAAFGPS